MPYAVHQSAVDPNLPNKVSNHSFCARRPAQLTIDSSKAQYYNFSQPHANGSFPTPPMTESPTSPRRHSQLSETSNASHENIYGSGTSMAAVPQYPTTIGTLGHRTQQVPPLYNPYSASGEPIYAQPMYQPPPLQRHSLSSFPPHISDYSTSFSSAHVLPAVPSQSYHYPLPSMNIGPGGPTSMMEASQPALRTQRRQKAHVAKACVNCKKAHLSCDDARPCNRCKTTGKEVCTPCSEDISDISPANTPPVGYLPRCGT